MRVLDIDLERLARGETASPRPFEDPDPARERLGRSSGTALGLALLARVEAAPSPPALVITVGACVRQGLPTAARASIAGRSPLTGRYAEGQVGSDLGRRLAHVADALVLRGRVPRGAEGEHELALARPAPATRPAPVLVIEATGRARVEPLAGLEGASTSRAHDLLARAFPDAAWIRIGPAGECAVPFASLAVGGAAPSFVGRGGLGAVFGALGLKALVVQAPPVPTLHESLRAPGRGGDLLQLLRSSPRLEARSTGGSFERFHAEGVRVEGQGEMLDPGAGARLSAAAGAAVEEKRGCAGCPTPCGWVFRGADGSARHATFSATRELGPRLGLERFEDLLELLAACDEAGLDAVEMGNSLALLDRAVGAGLHAGPERRGDLGRLVEAVQRTATGVEEGLVLREGTRALARRFGAELEGPAPAEPVVALARRVSSAGPDPMRTFPFLSDAAEHARLPELAATGGSEPQALARQLVFYENWKAAVDASGFCAFSAAGLLADGLCDLDALALRIAPAGALRDGMSPGAGLLAFGAALVEARLALDRQWSGADPLAPLAGDSPELARALAAYRELRGGGRVEAAAAPGPTGGVTPEHGSEAEVTSARGAPPGGGSSPGVLRLRGAGGLAQALGGELALELPAGMRLRDALELAAEARPAAGRYLLRGDRIVPAVYRAGRRLRADEFVHAGEVLDLVLAIRGG